MKFLPIEETVTMKSRKSVFFYLWLQFLQTETTKEYIAGYRRSEEK